MITNERQYKITNKLLTKLQKVMESFVIEDVSKKTGSEVLAKAKLDALRSEAEILQEQLMEYENLKRGLIKVLKANSLRDLPNILIQARIAQGLSQRQLADKLGIKEQQIQRYEADYYSNASLNRLSEVAEALKLNISEIAEMKFDPKNLIETKKEMYEIRWSEFPIEEMYRRGWFDNFRGSLDSAFNECDYLVKDFVTAVIQHPISSFHKKKVRSGNRLNSYSLIAWECRILHKASRRDSLTTFDINCLNDEWFNQLGALSKFKDGPIRAKSFLEDFGIRMEIEPHLPNTYLDGAALIHGNNPVIGITLRFDRLDNFWFVLFHELAHIVMHIRKGKLESIFDDLESDADQLESEADKFALNRLLPESIWETALPRFLRTESSVMAFAKEVNLNPAIIAGRIRYEAKNFIILNSLIGNGEVRKLFPQVSYGV